MTGDTVGDDAKRAAYAPLAALTGQKAFTRRLRERTSTGEILQSGC